MIELLSPVGDFSMLSATIKAGADAIYFGIRGFNMRASANNFSLPEAKKVIQLCHQNKIKAYCTINVIIYEKELSQLNKVLTALKRSKVDAIICWDLAVIKRCHEIKIPIHLSTQASVSNSESARLWKKFGIKRIVLARECALEDIKAIKQNSKIETEVFIHGARCISLSGRCFMSQELFNKSANRGECLQPCRREFKVIDEENKEMKLANNFVMSAKDLCTLPILPKILSTKTDSLKIEGRNRGADYVFKVTSVYRKALEAIRKNKFSPKLIEELMAELRSVYNKDFSTGYFIDYPHHQRANLYGSKSTQEKVLIGKVSNYYSKIRVTEFKTERIGFKIGDKIAFIGPTTGYHEETVSEIHTDKGKTSKAEKGQIVSIKVSQKVRENDSIYLVRNRK